MQPIDIDNVFSYHPPTGPDQVATYQAIRDGGKTLAKLIAAKAPDGPEKTLAIRKIQEAVMWANAGIACTQTPDTAPEQFAFGASGVLPCGEVEVRNDTAATERVTDPPKDSSRE